MQQKRFFGECQNGSHYGEPLSYLCFEEDCEKKGLICVLCLHEFHQGHSCEPLKSIVCEMEKDEESLMKNIELMAKIDEIKQRIKAQTQKIMDEDLRTLLNISINLYFQSIEDQCTQTENEQLKQIELENVEKIKNLLIKYKKKYNSFEQSNGGNSNKEKLIFSIINELQSKEETLKEAIKKGKVDNSLLSQFQVDNSYSSKKFYFSDKFINSGLTFQSSTKVKMNGYTDDYNYLVLCEPPLSPSKIQRIKFSMNNLSCYITVGISIKTKVEGNYQFTQNGLGHGCYHMSYDGYSWSDTDTAINNHYHSWYFNQGDKVTVEFNPKEKQVRFIKGEDEENCFKIPYEIDKKEKVHFSVSFNSEPEEVEIIQ